jgi:hypothetical protein
VSALAAILFFWGTLVRDLGPAEATLGMAAFEGIGPFGQAFGGWVSSLPFLQVLPSWLFARAAGPESAGWSGAVHVPAAIALLVLVVLVARSAWRALGPGVGWLMAIALLTSPAFLQRPTDVGFEPFTGLAVVAALIRIQSRGSDLVAGLLAALGVLSGGWPALAVIALPMLVAGRAGRYLSVRLVAPPLVAFVAWSAWAVRSASSLAWGEALAAPLQGAWSLEFPVSLLTMALPWSPFALLYMIPTVRSAFTPPQRQTLSAWLHAAGVAVLLGTVFPGCARAAWLPAQVAIGLVAAAALHALALREPVGAWRRLLPWSIAALCLTWGAVIIPLASYVAASISFYRAPGLVLAVSSIFTVAIALVAAWEARVRWSLAALVTLALGVQIGYSFIYAPELTYRAGAGPWGRAISQWVVPRSPIFVFHPWSPDVAFATGRPFRQLIAPQWLEHVDSEPPHFVLLLESEYEHWPKDAPEIKKLRTLHDRSGRRHVVARTMEDYPLVGLDVDDTTRRQ